MHEEVRAFWEARYSANVMTSALVGRQSLDELEGLARQAFSPIVDKRLAVPKFGGRCS